MHLLTPLLATALDSERRDAANRRALERRVRTSAAARPSRVRRPLAIALAALSRGSAGAVRRLDACLADELVGRLASSR